MTRLRIKHTVKKLKIKKLKPKKQTFRRWRKKPIVIWVGRSLMIVLIFVLGMGVWKLLPYQQHPKNIIWASDSNTTIPAGLVNYLQGRNDCTSYRGTGSPAGVGLYGVYQVTEAKFAKVSYGCSTNLTLYEMAVKQGKHWTIISPADYFSVSGYLPKCQQLDKYQISKSIEPYCITEDGTARANGVN